MSKKFRKYGEIEKVEIFKDKYFIPIDSRHYGYFAYVTYKKSDSAHKVLKDKAPERRRLPFKVQPADSWQQPIEEPLPTETDYFTQLPIECLCEIFDYLDMSTLVELAGTCQLFHSILHQRIFPKIEKFEFNFNRLEKVSPMSPVPLAKMHKYLLALGKYLKDVTLIFHFDQDEIPKNFTRIIDIFTHFMRENECLEVLNLHGLRFTTRILLQFQPILAKVKTLRYYGYTHNIDGYFYDSYDVDFASHCVNLETLKITQHILFQYNSEPWKKLQNITIGFPDFILTGNSEKFFQNNPQLRRLKLDGYRINFYLEDIIKYLPNLEKLTIFDILTDIEPYEANLLPQLRNLTKINFQELSSRNLNPLLDILATMPGLECIKISMDDDNEPVMNLKSIRRLATHLPHLRGFHLKHYKITEDIVLDLVQLANSLEVCCFRNCDVPLNSRFIQRIIDAWQDNERWKLRPLKLIMDISDDDKTREYLHRENVARIIQVDS